MSFYYFCWLDLLNGYYKVLQTLHGSEMSAFVTFLKYSDSSYRFPKVYKCISRFRRSTERQVVFNPVRTFLCTPSFYAAPEFDQLFHLEVGASAGMAFL